MKKTLIGIILVSWLMLPLAVYAQQDQAVSNAPPVAQPLVREGDFAVKLADALKIGKAKDEVEAETMLGSSGVAPKNGWIADYPVTPDIIAEIQQAIGNAADGGKLPMKKEQALKEFQDLTVSLGLPIAGGAPGTYAENKPPASSDYMSSQVINDYYYDEGPPVVTYYPPPWDYYYLYAWVPYPFWWGGFYFSGFFCLHDFHRVVFNGHHPFVVTNHFNNPATNRIARVDPLARRTGEPVRTTDVSRGSGFQNNVDRRGAASIFERSRERMVNSGNGFTQQPNNGFRGRNTISPNTGQQSFPRTGENGIHGRALSQHRVSGEHNTSGFNRAPGNFERSSGAPSRTFSTPSSVANRSSSGGGHSGGFAGRSFSSGHGGGGCRGRC